MGRGFVRWGGRFAPVLLATSVLAGCDDEPPPPPQNFPPVHYDYLTPIRLNVADVEVQDQSSPTDGDLSGRSPVQPAQAMQQMAHDRLVAAGGTGTATFVVTEASITRTESGITEHLAAKLEITNGSGGQAGFAEAHVTRSETPDDGAPAGPAALYELTRQAMDDMNVEFEYQVRHTLRDWVVTNGAVEAPVEQAPLTQGLPAAGGPLPLAPSGSAPGPAGSAPPPAFAPGAPTTLAPPPPAGAAATPGSMSPPPGYLTAPPGAVSSESGPRGASPGYPQPGAYPQSGGAPQPGYPNPYEQPATTPGTVPPYGYVPPSSSAYPPSAPQGY